MTIGIEAIAAERIRQIEKEGFDAEHDASHEVSELLAASVCYTNAARWSEAGKPEKAKEAPLPWPWEIDSYKPSDDTRRNLEKAGALIAAAIDRLENS